MAVQKNNLRRLLRTVEALSDLGPEMTAERDFPQTARAMVSALLQAGGAREGVLFTFSDKPSMLSSVASEGFALMPEPAIMADAATTTPPADTNQSGSFIRWWRQARTSFFWMVLVAFVLRFGWIIVAHTYRFKTFDDNFSFGWEMGRIGRSLAQGQGFSNPFSATTGPTACARPDAHILRKGSPGRKCAENDQPES